MKKIPISLVINGLKDFESKEVGSEIINYTDHKKALVKIITRIKKPAGRHTVN